MPSTVTLKDVEQKKRGAIESVGMEIVAHGDIKYGVALIKQLRFEQYLKK